MSTRKKPWRRNYNRELDAVTKPGSLHPAGSAKIPLWMVMGRDAKDKPWQPYAAYPSRIQAEVYSSGFSNADRVRIIKGRFSPND